MKLILSKWAVKTFLVLLVLFAVNGSMTVFGSPFFQPGELDAIETELNAYIPDPQYKDDPFIVVTIQEAIQARKENNGGIGACLVLGATGQVVERGHNRQNTPYLQSSLHAEMDLLDRYEDRVKDTGKDARKKKEGLVLYSSVEPCPMCMTRIINSGVKIVLYAANDETGGMAHLIGNLPPFWQNMAQGMVIGPADCSPYLRDLAEKLFHPQPKSCAGCAGK